MPLQYYQVTLVQQCFSGEPFRSIEGSKFLLPRKFYIEFYFYNSEMNKWIGGPFKTSELLLALRKWNTLRNSQYILKYASIKFRNFLGTFFEVVRKSIWPPVRFRWFWLLSAIISVAFVKIWCLVLLFL